MLLSACFAYYNFCRIPFELAGHTREGLQSHGSHLDHCRTTKLIEMEPARPTGISETTWAMSVLNLLVGYAAIDWHGQHVASSLALPLAMVVARYVVLWFYWDGYNWARILVLLASLAALWNLTSWAQLSAFIHVVVALKAALGIFLLYWLNTRNPKQYFDPKFATLL